MNIKDILRALLIVIMTVGIPPHALPQSDADDEINRLKTIYGDGPELITALDMTSQEHFTLGNYALAAALQQPVLEYYRSTLSESSYSYICAANLAGRFMSLSGRHAEAIALLESVLPSAEKISNLSMAALLNNLSQCYSEAGQFEKSISISRRVIVIMEQYYPNGHSDLATCLLWLSTTLSTIGEYTEAIAQGNKALKMIDNLPGDNRLLKANTLNNLALVYLATGNKSTAAEMLTRTHNMLADMPIQDPNVCLNTLMNMSTLYNILGDNDKAFDYGKKCIDIVTTNVDELKHNKPILRVLFSNLSSLNLEYGNYSEARRMALASLALRKELFGIYHHEYALGLLGVAKCDIQHGDYGRALYHLNMAADILRAYPGPEHQMYINVQYSMIGCYFKQGNYRRVLDELPDLMRKERARLRRNFAEVNPQSQADMFSVTQELFYSNIPDAAVRANDSRSAALMYDNALFSKGLLLTSEQRLRQLILESGDSTALSNYHNIMRCNAEIKRLTDGTYNPDSKQLDNLRAEIDTRQRVLMSRVREYGDITESFDITWHDIHKALKKNDIAIEFVTASEAYNRKAIFAAVISPSFDTPRLVRLCATEDVVRIDMKTALSTDSLSKKIWLPLAPYMTAGCNVHFAADGILTGIPIEYVPYGPEGKPFNSIYHTYRLSTTKRLAMPRQKGRPDKSIVLAGGFDYGIADNVSWCPTDSLAGAEAEVKGIAQTLAARGIKAKAMTGAAANEQWFKGLSGKSPSVLHIATHGFYWNKNEMRYMGFRNPDAMHRSGLLMAGVNSVRTANSIVNSDDKGILTTDEISRLDLRGTRLVVLSACQTGLGDVSGEGVFGLQRAFKLAGAGTIIMSLWPVSDTATELLMNYLYAGMADGSNLTDAFGHAQNRLREYTDTTGRHPFTGPEYTAPFIILDADRQDEAVTER